MPETSSLWIATAGETDYPPLAGDARFDVAVLGGGVIGLTTALLLKRAGRRVAVVEAGRVARGVTARTTAKISSLHGLVYNDVQSSFGQEGARVYGEANQAGLEWMAAYVADEKIDCDFRRRDNYTYTESPEDVGRIEQEVDAAAKAGLPAAFVEDVPLPFPVAAAVRFSGQAEFHPLKYLLAMAGQIAGDGCEIYEQTRALGVKGGSPSEVETSSGTMRADDVIVATHFPFLDRGLFFARQHPERSYAIAMTQTGEPPDGMFLSTETPAHSIRSHPVGRGELLLVGGESHKTGQGGNHSARYRRLEAYARERFDVGSVEHRWSTQDNMPVDGVPYIGKLTPVSGRIHVATGMKKWGLAQGTAAAMILSDAVMGRRNPWSDLYSPSRMKPLASATELVKENANVAKRFVGDRFRKPDADELSDIAQGEGRVVTVGGEKVAAYRDEHGGVHAVSPVCTHLFCLVDWNDAERSWDCPCHGSRFDVDGRVIQGPAVKDLEPKVLTVEPDEARG